MGDILKIEKATKRFQLPEGGQISALENVSLRVAENEFLTLLGPSGCGKTTLLRAISGFEDLDSGEIHIAGEPMGNRPAHLRPVNTVFQKYALFPHLSVGRNVSYSLEVSGVDKDAIRHRVGAMLEMVGLDGLDNRRISQLSGGQQQRVALARSLVAQPKILLLDEPLSALDKNLRHKMQTELKGIQDRLGISFIFVTHDQEEALVMSDRIAVLNNGRIQQLDAPEALYHRPETEFVARFIGESNLISGTVKSASPGQAKIMFPDGHLATTDAADVAIGDKVQVLLRPENLTIATGVQSGGHTITATVREHYFVGTDYRLVVSADGFPPIKATLRNIAGDTVKATGAKIDLFLPYDAMHVIGPARDAS